MEITQQEVNKTQGTRLQEKAPWETYNASFEEKLDPKLEDEIKRYAKHRHEKSSNQNEEELCRQKELSNEVAKQYQWVTPDEYANAEERIGRIIHSSEFITILRNKCGLKCWYRDHPQPRKITLVVQRKDLAPEVGCWCQLGFMPEYEIMDFDEHGVPLDSKYRGWRTCLLQLILKGLLSEEVVNRVFREPTGPASKRSLETLHGFRNRTIEVI
jgi:hypothetical protein